MELSKTFGAGLPAGAMVGVSYLSGDGGAYAYAYTKCFRRCMW